MMLNLHIPHIVACAARSTSKATTTTNVAAASRSLFSAWNLTSIGKFQTTRSITTTLPRENVAESAQPSECTTFSKPSPLVSAHLQAATEAETKAAIEKLREQGKFYAVVDLIGRSYLIAPRDIVHIQNCKEAKVGDVISFDHVREIGSKDFTIRGQPYVSSDYYNIKGMVIEKPIGKDVTTIKFNRRQGYHRTRVSRLKFTSLRITEIEVKNV